MYADLDLDTLALASSVISCEHPPGARWDKCFSLLFVWVCIEGCNGANQQRYMDAEREETDRQTDRQIDKQ